MTFGQSIAFLLMASVLCALGLSFAVAEILADQRYKRERKAQKAIDGH